MDIDVCFLLTAAAASAVLLIHIIKNMIMSEQERTWYAAATGVVLVCNLLEVACNSGALAAAHPGFFSCLLLFELVITPLYMPFKCFAFGKRKLGHYAMAFCGLCAAALLVLYFCGKLFQIDAQGNYVGGGTMIFEMVTTLPVTLADLIVLYIIGRNFHTKDPEMLIGIYAMNILMFVFYSFDDASSVSMLGGTICFILAYIYYDGMKQAEARFMLQKVSLETIQAIVNAIDAKDEYTKGHSKRVAEYSRILAEHLGYRGDDLNRLYYAAALHDVGKIGIPDSVLNKPGRLDDVEFSMMREHARRGSTIAKQITLLPEAYSAARNHHERFDGRGYPDRLAGKEIPEIARIIGVADAYDAMNSDRIYRKALPREVVRSEMEKGIGTQFDPDFAKLFIELMDSGELDAVSETGRADMEPVHEDDDFTKLTKDILEFFLLKKEFTGEWDATFDKWDALDSYIQKITEKNNVGFDLVVVSIKPAEGRAVTQEQQEQAISVMQASAEKILITGNICTRISQHQLALVFRSDNSRELSVTMQDIMIYFYKIFESQPFSIDYHVINRK